MPPPKTVAIFLPNWVGDVVMATPALRALRLHFADSTIVHVGRPVALQTLAGSLLSDEQIDAGGGLIALARRLRRRRVDLAVLLPNSFRAALAARLGGAKRVAGYDRDGRGWFLTDKLSPTRDERGRFVPVPTIDYYNAVAVRLGARQITRRLELAATPEADALAHQLLEEAGADPRRPLVMLNPGAAFGSSKMWFPDRYAAVADALIERHGAHIIINAAPSEREIAAQVARAMRHKPILNFAERESSLGLLKSLLRRGALLVTNDTGARHVAAAFGAGVVTLFGSTDPVWAQIDYPLERIVRVDVPCSPCQRKKCPRRAGGGHHQCMKAITAEMVLSAAEEILAPRARGTPPPAAGGERQSLQPASSSHVRGDPLLDAVREAGLNTLEGALAYGGGENLDKPRLGHRRRTRLVLMDSRGTMHELFLKRYGVHPLRARLRRLLAGSRRSEAGVEYDNILAAGDAGVSTMRAVVCGEERGLLGPRRSYVIVTRVPGEALERCGEEFLRRHQDQPRRLRELTEKLADLVRRLHAAGLVHRDLYASHVFLEERQGEIHLHLIDLARVFSPRRKFRWRVKDLAQLKYSMPAAWTTACWEDFMAAYLDGAAGAARYAAAIDRKVAWMRRRAERKGKGTPVKA
jgi:heptosyltransferase-2